jgi:hypothetical protein
MSLAFALSVSVWIALGASILLAFRTLRNKLYTHARWFCVFIYSTIARTVALEVLLFIHPSDKRIFAGTYYVSCLVCLSIATASIIETFLAMYSPKAGAPASVLKRIHSYLAIGILSPVVCGLASPFLSPARFWLIAHYADGLELAIYGFMFAAVWVLAANALSDKLTWKQCNAGIIYGFILNVTFEFFLSLLIRLYPQHVGALGMIGQSAYLVALTIWNVYLWKPEPAALPDSPKLILFIKTTLQENTAAAAVLTLGD